MTPSSGPKKKKLEPDPEPEATPSSETTSRPELDAPESRPANSGQRVGRFFGSRGRQVRTAPQEPPNVANAVARFLAAQGVRRVYGLCGGHIQPIWDELPRMGISIVDTRHEGAAVHM